MHATRCEQAGVLVQDAGFYRCTVRASSLDGEICSFTPRSRPRRRMPCSSVPTHTASPTRSRTRCDGPCPSGAPRGGHRLWRRVPASDRRGQGPARASADIFMVDINEAKRCTLARVNARLAGLVHTIEARHGVTYSPHSTDAFDFMVANPPYLVDPIAAGLPPRRRCHWGRVCRWPSWTPHSRPSVAGRHAGALHRCRGRERG